MSILRPGKHMLDKQRERKSIHDEQQKIVGQAESLFGEVSAMRAEDEARFAEKQAKMIKDDKEFEGRKKNMGGATRTGLMQGGNAQGVV